MQAVNLARVADHLLVLGEAETIGADLAVLEQRLGHSTNIDDLRQRVQRVRLMVLAKLLLALLALQDTATESIH
jgi:hypothetical protein